MPQEKARFEKSEDNKMKLPKIKKCLESRMLGNLHVRFGVGVGVQIPGLHHRIDCNSFPLCRTFDEMMSYLKALKDEKHDYQTLVIDSLDWAEKLVFAHVCKQFGAKNIEKADGGYARGYEHALTYWDQMIDAIRPLREEKGMIIILLAHAKIEKHNDPESAEFDRFSPKLHKKANALWCEWCDAILLATREFGAAKGEKSGGKRILRCIPSATCNAKNRYNLPEIMPLEWEPLMKQLIANN